MHRLSPMASTSAVQAGSLPRGTSMFSRKSTAPCSQASRNKTPHQPLQVDGLRQVRGQQRGAGGRRQPLGRLALAHPAAALEVQPQQPSLGACPDDQTLRRIEPPILDRPDVRHGLRIDPATEGRQASVQPPLAGEHVDDLLVQTDRHGQQRGIELVRLGREADEPVPQQRRLRREMGALRQLLAGRGAQEVQGQVHGGPPAGHVILEVRVDPLILQVDVRAQGDEDDVEIEG